MASPQYETTINNLPKDVLSKEIFIRLLAKQLAQMRCVSKSWNSLLSDSAFIKSHLKRSLQKNDEILLVTGTKFSFNPRSSSFEFGASPFTPRLSRTPDVKLTNFIKFPVINNQDNIGFGEIIGSLHGLICFTYVSSLGEFTLHIWNPSLSAFLSLPPCPHEIHLTELGFGYDPKNDDYKIVKITPAMEPQVEVYSMRKGSWKLITQRLPSNITMCQGASRVCVDGVVNWLYDPKIDELERYPQILAFDLDLETFKEIPLPDVYDYSKWLLVLGGKLCVMSCNEEGECGVWVMKEYGVADSWAKHHKLPQFTDFIIPYAFTPRGEFLSQADEYTFVNGLIERRFGLYDPIAAKMKTFEIRQRYSLCEVIEYVDSLVWVAPPSQSYIGQSFCCVIFGCCWFISN